MATIEELGRLRECEDHVEFKEAKHNYPFAGGKKTDPTERRHCVLGYIVALANEKGGRLVLGMTDTFPHNVVGSDFAINQCGALEDEVYERLHVRVHTEELFVNIGKEQRRVLVINVPSRPIGKALRFEGVPLMRVGESLREMDDREYFSVISEQDTDFSARVCKGFGMDDIDTSAVDEMKRLISTHRNRTEIISTPIKQLLSDYRLMTEGGLTYAALLLLGKSEAITKYAPQCNVVIEYRSSHEQVRYTARKEFREPLFVAIKSIWNYLNQPASNPLIHIMDLPQIIDIPSFNEETIREAVLNACIHRSLQMNSDIFIKQYPDRIEITNPGGFPYGVNRSNILSVNSSPRSRLMAEVIEKAGLIERSGQGVDIMYANCIKEGRSLPDYSHSDDYQVSLIIRSDIADPMFTLFMQDISSKGIILNVYALLNLYYIHRHHLDSLYEDELPLLLDNGLIVGHPYYKYVLGESYFANMEPAKKGICTPSILLRIFYALEECGNTVAMSTFIERLEGMLTQKQTRNIIEKLCECGFLVISGNGKSTRYSKK
jgi:ATP-dependent DNA helicase RecG